MAPPHNTRLRFFDEKEIKVAIYPVAPQFDFQFRATLMIIAVEGRGFIEWSEDTNERVDGKIIESDGPIVFDDIDVRKLWFRTNKTPKVRVWARRRQA